MSFPGHVPGIEPVVAVERLAAGGVALDVRENDEWAAGRIGGALHIPMGELAQRRSEIPSDRSIVAVCRSGSRSAVVTQALLQAGYEVENLTGGLEAWQAAGLPIDPPGGWIA
jgi:rhodanese-related sulfurtransferase